MRYEKWLTKHAERLDGKIAVVTGANSGIGYETARHLLSLGTTVILACRSAERGRTALEHLLTEFPKGKAELLMLDLASFASIDAFAENIRERGQAIHILIHCAGVYYPREAATADGLPSTVGVNYVGTVRLTEALLAAMAQDGQVIFTTSLVDRFGKLRKGAPAPHGKEGYRDYAESKLLLSAYACRKAAERGEKEPAFITVHPGITATSLLDPSKTSHNPLFSRLGHGFLYLFTHPKEKAALTAVLAAAGDMQNGDCIGPRGPFGISGYPRRTRFCQRVKKQAKIGKDPYTG